MKKGLAFLLGTIGIILIGIAVLYIFMARPMSNNTEEIEVTIPSGMSIQNIGKLLENKELIRDATFFTVYVKLNEENALKASTYTLNKSMSLSEIVAVLTDGNSYNPNVVSITFKEGENVTSYMKLISEQTNNSYDDVLAVMKDVNYIQGLISRYWFLTDDILNADIYYPLEGYLAPNTYQFKDKNVTTQEIIEVMLNQTEKDWEYLRKDMINGKYSVHEYVTIASLAQLEGTNKSNRKEIAGVFYNRLDQNMSLGSDVTTYYALQVPMTRDLTVKEFNTANPYNTRGPNMLGKMPVGPICNPEVASLEASVYPTQSDNLYFVADKNGKIYFTKTHDEHLQKVQEIKDNGDWIW